MQNFRSRRGRNISRGRGTTWFAQPEVRRSSWSPPNMAVILAQAAKNAGPAPLVPFNDEEARELLQYWSDDSVRTFLGIPDNVEDISDIMNNSKSWETYRSGQSWHTANDDRARQHLIAGRKEADRIQAAMAQEDLESTLYGGQRDRQFGQLYRPRGSTQGRADAMLARQGYPGSEARGDLPIPDPDWEPEAKPKVAPAPTPSVSLGEMSSILLQGAGMGLGKVAEPFDIFSQTVAELAGQTTKIGGEGWGDILKPGEWGFEAPTIATKGWSATVEKFRDRPMWQQFALGILDPTIILGGGKFMAKALTGSIGKLSTKQAGKVTWQKVKKGEKGMTRKGYKGYWRFTREITPELQKEMMEGIAREEKRRLAKLVPHLPGSGFEVFLSRVVPSGVAKRLPKAFAEKLDPSSRIGGLPPGTPERLIKEATVGYNNAVEAGDGFTEIILANLRTKFNVHDVLGTKTGFEDISARATKVKNLDGTYSNPYAGNVIERPDMFDLTTEQRELVEYLHEVFGEAFKYFEGVEKLKIDEVGAFSDIMHYFPRRIVDAVTKKSRTELGAGGGRSVGTHRTATEMADSILAKGKRYDGIYEVVGAYFRGAYREVAKKRALEHVQPLLKNQSIADYLKIHASHVKNISMAQKNVTRAFAFVGRAGRAVAWKPTETELAEMVTAFPSLQPAIRDIMTYDPETFPGVVARLSDELVGGSGLTKERIQSIIDNVLERERLGTQVVESPLDIEARELAQRFGVDIPEPEPAALLTREEALRGALTEAGVEMAKAEELVDEAIKQARRVSTEAKEQAVTALHERMREIQLASEAALKSADETVLEAQSIAARPGQSESASQFFKGEIVKEFTSEDGSQYASGADLAAALDKALMNEPSASKIIRSLSSINSTLRFAKTAVDFGAPLIQGLPLLMRDPEMWGEVTKAHLWAFLDPRVRSRYVSFNAVEITEMVSHGGLLGSSEFTDVMADGGWFANLPMTITDGPVPLGVGRRPVAGVANIIYKTTNRFATSFETFLDLARIETWKALRPLAKNEADLNQLASFVNKFTGVMSPSALGIPRTQQQFESALPLFSPRYTRASIGLIFDMARGGLRAGLARDSLSKLAFGAIAYHVGISRMLGQEPNLDPTKPGMYMRNELYGQMFGPGGKHLSLGIKAPAKITMKMFQNPQDVENQGRNDFLSWDVFSADTYRKNPILGILRGQSSMVATTGIALVTGADPLGEIVPGADDPIEMGTYAAGQAKPFWLDAMLAAAETGNFKSVLFAGLVEGGGMSSHAVPTYKKRDELRDKYMLIEFGKTYEYAQTERGGFGARGELNQLREKKDKDGNTKYPDLIAMEELTEKEAHGRKNSRDRIEVGRKQEEYKNQYIENTNVYGKEFLRMLQAGDLNAQDAFRKAHTVNGNRKRTQYDSLKEQNPEVFESKELYWLAQGKKLAEDGDYMLMAQSEYFDRMSSDEAIIQSTGMPNFIAIDKIHADMDTKYGKGTMDAIEEEAILNMATDRIHPLVLGYIESFTRLRPYWEAYKTEVPEEHWTKWQIFDQSPPMQQQKMYTSTEYPYARWERDVEVKRSEMRQENAEMDFALVLYYRKRPMNLQTMENLVRAFEKGGLTNP